MPQKRTGYGSRGRGQTRPIPAGVWATLITLIGVAAWTIGLPLAPFLWLGILVGGATAQYPASPTGRKTDPPAPRSLARYHTWKNRQKGLIPGKNWTDIWRVSWWAGLFAILPFSANLITPLLIPVNMLFSFMSMQAYVYARDRKQDHRHPYQGVSVPAFLTKAPAWQRIVALGISILLLLTLGVLWLLLYVPGVFALGIPALTFLLLVTLMDKTRQSGSWRQAIEWQTTLDRWIEDSPMAKPWADAYVSQVNTFGPEDNRMTVLRVRLPHGVEEAMKAGVDRVKPEAIQDGFNFVCLLYARSRKTGKEMFSPNSLRLVVGKTEACIPDITVRSCGEKVAGLVADIAYAQCSLIWKKTPPLIKAHDVSADPEKAAWLLEFTMPQTGGTTVENIGIDWLAYETNPGTYIHLPVINDVDSAFELAALADTPLSDEGNKWRHPDIVTASKSFDRYMKLSRRFRSEQAIWTTALQKKLPSPTPSYDEEQSEAGDGWTLNILPMTIPAPHTVADYARYDLRTLAPQAQFVGLAPNGNDMMLVTVNGSAPHGMGEITGNKQHQRLYAAAILFKALCNALPAHGTVSLRGCSQEGKDVAIWRAIVDTSNGATIADLRKKTGSLLVDTGVKHILWDWRSPSNATIWLMNHLYTSVEDIPHFKKPQRQKDLIPLALSNAWGDSGVKNTTGETPQALGVTVFENNHDVLKVPFRVPTGLSMANVDANQEKFLIAAGYSYGRIIPNNKETTDAGLFTMALAKHSPFPTSVDADWDYAGRCDVWTYPLGVDDLGNPVSWNTKVTPHILVCGKSGTGKSSAAQVIVMEALLKGSDIILIDPSKGCVDFTQWAKPKALAFVGEGQLRETTAVIGWLRHEMSIRVRLNTKYGVGNFDALNPDDMDPEDRPHAKRILLFFDEFNSYLQKMGKPMSNPNNDVQIANSNAVISATNANITKAMSNLSEIAVQGRTAGIDLVLGAQRLTMDDMKRFNANAFFRTLGRILLGSDSPMGVVSMNNIRSAGRLQKSLAGSDGTIPRGRGIYESADGTLNAVQTWWSGGQEKLAPLVESIPTPAPIDYSAYMPVEAEQFGEMSQEELAQALKGNAGDEEEMSAEELEDFDSDDDMDDIEDVDW